MRIFLLCTIHLANWPKIRHSVNRTLLTVLIVILHVNGLIRSPIYRYSSSIQRHQPHQQPVSFMTDVQHEKDSIKAEGKGGLKINNLFDLSQYRINKAVAPPSVSIVNDTDVFGTEGNGTMAGNGSVGSSTTFGGSRFGFYTPQQPIMLTKAENELQSLKSELSLMKSRLEKVEKASVAGKKTTISSFMDSLAANTLEMNAKTVELCAVCAFFAMGTVVGASMLDRLWLLGGLLMAWWASGAVHRDTRGGMVARRVGVQVAAVIRDVQEKYNQFVIFYQTGKLAYYTSKIWEQYDTQFAITQRTEEMKRRAMKRAADFNTAFKDQQWGDQISDLWKVVVSAPSKARRWNKEIGLTSSLTSFGKGLYGTVSDTILDVMNRGSSSGGGNTKDNNARNKGYSSSGIRYNNRGGRGESYFSSFKAFSVPYKNNNKRQRYRLFWWLNGPNSNNNNKGMFSSFFSSGPGPNYRGRLVNPWIPAWTYLDIGGTSKRTSSSASSGVGRGDWWPKDRQKGPPWWSQEGYLAQAM